MEISQGPDDFAAGTGRRGRGQDDAGPALSVTELFRAHHLELVRLAVVMVGDLATAEDIVQDCYERLHRRWHVIREPGRALAYARSAVLNSCRSAHRRSSMSRRYWPKLAQPGDASVPDAAAATADRGQLADALRQLPRRQREVLVLRYYADLSVAEIAETLGISPSNARACVSRGLAALAALIGEEKR